MKKMNNQLCNDDWGWFIDLEDLKCKQLAPPPPTAEISRNLEAIDEEYEYYMNVQNYKKEAELEENYSKRVVLYDNIKKIGTSIVTTIILYTILWLC